MSRLTRAVGSLRRPAMTLAQLVALLVVLLALGGVALAAAVDGLSPAVVLAVLGCAAFGAGVWFGHSALTAVGLATTAVAVGVALSTGRSRAELGAIAVLGVAASALLVLADASWWLRREPQVDGAVMGGLVRAMAPVWFVGGALGVAAASVSRLDQPTLWLLPLGVAAAGGLVGLVAVITRRRHPRLDPLSDLRR